MATAAVRNVARQSVRKTLKFLLDNKMVVPKEVKQVTFEVATRGPGLGGMR